MYLDSENWLKGSIEYENDNFQHLGSVVTNKDVYKRQEQIALILYPLKDCFKIRDTGEYRGYETDCTDTVSYTHLITTLFISS